MIRKSMMNFRAIIAVALLVLSINFIRCALIYMSLNLIIPIGNAFASCLSVRGKRVWKHGQGLESNPAAIVKRIEYLQEELVDALMYCEWIKDKIKEGEPNDTMRKNHQTP